MKTTLQLLLLLVLISNCSTDNIQSGQLVTKPNCSISQIQDSTILSDEIIGQWEWIAHIDFGQLSSNIETYENQILIFNPNGTVQMVQKDDTIRESNWYIQRSENLEFHVAVESDQLSFFENAQICNDTLITNRDGFHLGTELYKRE